MKFTTIKDDVRRINGMFCFKRIMCSLCLKSHKIFRAIIIFDFIDMMTGFFWFKKSFDLFFNYKPMFKNISSFIFIRMIKTHDTNISQHMLKSPSLPFSIFISNMFSKGGFSHLFFSFFRASTTIIKMSWPWRKSFFHCFTLFFTSCFCMFTTPLRMIFLITKSFFLKQAHFLFGDCCLFGTFFHKNIITYFKYNRNYIFRMRRVLYNKTKKGHHNGWKVKYKYDDLMEV